jgi:predicted DNA-binding helix-hairpin-helix protein
MDIEEKVKNLTQSATLDCDGPQPVPHDRQKTEFLNHSRVFVTHPSRGKIPVMRTMLTSACERNCYYCPFRAGRDFRRVWLKPEELARAFDEMQRRKMVDGLFLSNGIIGGGVRAMDDMLDTVTIIRRKYNYSGYVHLKLMPGADTDQIETAARLSDRLSINLEGANAERLQKLAPKKDFRQELLPPLTWLRKNQQRFEPWVKIPSLTTQFVVGPAGESDQELLKTVSALYQQAGLARAYYSAFNPIAGTPLEHTPKTKPIRQHRLYQADWLLRFYGFSMDDLPFDQEGNLSLATDPKIVWAEQHLKHNPVEINRAARIILLRVPGLGPQTVTRILSARRQTLLTDITQLRQLGVNINRAAPYLLINGKQQGYQLSFPGI